MPGKQGKKATAFGLKRGWVCEEILGDSHVKKPVHKCEYTFSSSSLSF
jgi:hypothetical protein